MNANNPAPSVEDDIVPKYSASEQPVTWGARLAFQIWVWSTLLTVVVALILYLLDKLVM